MTQFTRRFALKCLAISSGLVGFLKPSPADAAEKQPVESPKAGV